MYFASILFLSQDELVMIMCSQNTKISVQGDLSLPPSLPTLSPFSLSLSLSLSLCLSLSLSLYIYIYIYIY